MALIPGLIRTMQHYKAEKERLAKEAEGKDGGAIDYGPGLSFDEGDALAGSGLPKLPQMNIPRPDYSRQIYKPAKPE